MIRNGAKIENVEYPVAFTKSGGLVGIGASKDLEPMTPYLEFPESLVYNRKTVYNSEIGHLMDKYPEVFNKHHEVDLAIVIYCFYERLKGDKSHWKPYYDIINVSDLPAFWSDDEINEFQDRVMIGYV